MTHKCRHCKGNLVKPNGAGRGLCWTCYRKPDIKAQYSRRKPGPKTEIDGDWVATEDVEPTAEEVEATVAKQMECLPEWWENDCEREPVKYTLVKCS